MQALARSAQAITFREQTNPTEEHGHTKLAQGEQRQQPQRQQWQQVARDQLLLQLCRRRKAHRRCNGLLPVQAWGL